MTKLTDALGHEDEDVLDFKKAVGGLAFSGFSDDEIAAFAIEEAQAFRRELREKLAAVQEKRK